MTGIARAPGTCGELVQGKVDGLNFLITWPIDLYSTVKVELNDSGFIEAGCGMLKVREAVYRVLNYLDRSALGAVVTVTSDIPRGKGMASSTADIAAACAATAAALKQSLTPQEISKIALSIEPTDGIMYPGITMFDHVKGSFCRVLGEAPEVEAVIVDLGGTVDTVTFNSKSDLDLMNSKKASEVKTALELVELAFKRGSGEGFNPARLLGKAAAISAFANQHILYKSNLELLQETCEEYGGVGLNIAHSGTVVGLLFETGFLDYPEVFEQLRIQGFQVLGKSRIINGGIEVLEEGVDNITWQPLNTYMEETFGKLRKNTG